MPVGAGKYDDECTAARIACEAAGAVLIIWDGKKGSGFAAQGDLGMYMQLPEVLEEIVQEIRRSGLNAP